MSTGTTDDPIKFSFFKLFHFSFQNFIFHLKKKSIFKNTHNFYFQLNNKIYVQTESGFKTKN